MNKILVVSILTLSSPTFGQFSINDFIFNGTFLLNSELNPHSTTGYSTESTNSISIRSSVGIFINKNFELGGLLGYSIANREEDVRSMHLDFKTTLLSAGIYGQRYFTLSKKLHLTIHASIIGSTGADKYISKFPITTDISTEDSKIFQFSPSVRPTVIFFPIPKFGIQGGLGSIKYLYSRKLKTDNTQSEAEINYWPITLSLTYYMDKRISD
jgi:hypothetical protein